MTWVLPGRAQNSVRVLIPDDRVAPWGFHDATLVDMVTFLSAHSWLNWVDEGDDEDEVGLKENPEDTRYIKKITSK